MSFVKGLKCRECGYGYPVTPTHVCEFCFGPLEVDYNYEEIQKSISREKIASRPQTMWRYRELLPIDGEPTVGRLAGFTPLVKAERLAEALGVKELYIKNDAVTSGYGQFLGMFRVGNHRHEDVMNSKRLFAEHVMPRLREVNPDSGSEAVAGARP